MRGVKFGIDIAGDILPLMEKSSQRVAGKSLNDVAEWLGFRDLYSYLSVLQTEGKKILKRAQS